MNPATFTSSERRFTLAGLLIVYLLAALDQTVVTTAMPRIITELHGLSLYAWVATAYLLTSTVMVPIWGKLSDLFGRKPALLGAILFFILGSSLAGLSGEFGRLPLLGGGMQQLVVFRAIQGVGGGGLFTIAFTIIADLYPPAERAKLGAIFGAVFALTSTLGPLIGGYFTDHGSAQWFGHTIAGWRFVFYVNLPLSLLSVVMIVFRMPRMKHKASGRLDLLGALLIISFVVPLLLALTWGGQARPWSSPLIIALFAASAVALGAYVAAERYAPDPIVPLALFRNRMFTMANLASFLMSMSFMSTIAFLPLFIQLAQGAKATASGLAMLPLMVGLMISSRVTGRLAGQIGRYRSFMLGGVLLTGLAIWLLSRMDAKTAEFDLIWRLALLGIALGPGQSLFMVAVQNGAVPGQLGVVTSSSMFFRQMGSTVGIAVFGAILTNNLRSSVGVAVPGADLNQLRGMAVAARMGLEAQLPDVVRQAVAAAITHTIALSLLTLAAALIAVLLIPPVPMRQARASMSDRAAKLAA